MKRLLRFFWCRLLGVHGPIQGKHEPLVGWVDVCPYCGRGWRADP